MTAGARAKAVTLLELLVALALGALVTLAATRLWMGSRQRETGLTAAADAVRTLDLAAELLAAEVRRAGYHPYPAPPDDSLPPSAAMLGLDLDAGDEGDALVVRSLDDRVVGPPVTRDLRFVAAEDRRGVAQLYRATASGTRQPLVEGIRGMRVEAWADRSGWHGRQELRVGALRPWLLVLALRTRDGSERRVAVALPSRPLTEVVRSP